MKRYTKAIIISTIGLLLIGTASLAVIGMNYRPPVAVSAVATQPPTVAELLKLVNEERAKNNIAPLVLDDRLNQSAQKKADDMLNNDYYSHYSPTTGANSHDYIANTGIQCADTSENIDENSTSSLAVSAWIGSPPHFKAMIDVKYTLTGLGIAGKDKSGYYLFVEHFCQP